VSKTKEFLQIRSKTPMDESSSPTRARNPSDTPIHEFSFLLYQFTILRGDLFQLDDIDREIANLFGSCDDLEQLSGAAVPSLY
jgi:hypothetical protein